MSKQRLTAQQRRDVIERAEACCEYCQSQARYSMSPFSVDHIIPQSVGGRTVVDNLGFSCQGCNGCKYDKQEGIDLVTGRIVPLYNPRQQTWAEHFSWNADCSEIIGLTEIGRATIVTLKLNRIELVNLREILYPAGVHPPVLTPK